MKKTNKLITTAVVGAAAFGMTQAPVHANDTTEPTQPPGVEGETPIKHVTQEEITQAKHKVDELQNQYDNKDDELNNIGDQLNSKKQEKEIQERTVNVDENVTEGDAQTARTKVQEADRKVREAKTKKAEADQKVADTESELALAKNNKQTKETELNNAKNRVNTLSNGRNASSDLEREKSEKERDRDREQVKKISGDQKVNEVQNELNEAKRDDANHTTRLENARTSEEQARTSKDQARRELDNAKTSVKTLENDLNRVRGGNILHEIKLPDGYIRTNPLVVFDRIKRELGREPDFEYVDPNDFRKGYRVIGDPNPGRIYQTLDDAQPTLDALWDDYFQRRNRLHNQYVNADYINQEAAYRAQVENEIKNFYQTHKVENGDTVLNWNNISREERKALTIYAVNLLNSMRAQLGKGPVKANDFMIDFADEVGKVRVRDGADTRRHYGKGINEVARRHGMSASEAPGVQTTRQFYENLMSNQYTEWSTSARDFVNIESGVMTKQKLYEVVAKYMVGFLLEGDQKPDYGHFLSLVDDRSNYRVGVGFSTVNKAHFMGVYSADPDQSQYFDRNEQGEETKRKLRSSDVSLGTDTTELERKLQNARQVLSEKLGNFDQAERAHNDAETTLNNLSNHVSKVNTLERKLAEANRELEESVNKINTLTDEINDLNTRITNQNANDQERARLLREAQTKVDEAQNELDESVRTVARTEIKLGIAKNEQSKADDNVRIAERELEMSSTTLRNKENALRKLADDKAKLQQIEAEIARLKALKGETEQDLMDIHRKLEDAIREYNRLALRYQIENQKPSDPKPSEPTEPKAPEKPSDPKPSEPTEPKAPEKPTEPKAPEKPSDPKPSEPTEPKAPEKPTEPKAPEKPKLPKFPILPMPQSPKFHVDPAAPNKPSVPVGKVETHNPRTTHIHEINNDYFVGTKGEKLPNTGVANTTSTTGLGILAFVGGIFATKRRKN